MIRRLALLAASLTLALAATSGQASAAVNHPFLSAITNLGLEDACGAAYKGGLYVSDYYHNRIVTPGSPMTNVDPTGGPCKLAFDPSGNLYVNNWHHNVKRYGSGEIPAGSGSAIDSSQPTGLAVDPGSGDLYVAHRTYVAKYTAPVSAGNAPAAIIGEGSLNAAYGIGVSNYPATDGYLYVPDAADHTVKVFDPATSLETPVAEMDGSATPQEGFVHLVDSEVAVDQSSGHVYILDVIGHGLSEHPAAALDEFNAAGEFRGQVTGFTSGEPSGIAIDEETGNLYVTSGNSEGSAVFVYGPTAPAHRLVVTKLGTGDGSLTSSPKGIHCGSACAAEYDEGKQVTLFATPDGHSNFSGWVVVGSQPCPGTGSCTVLMNADVQVTATFTEPTQQTLTVTETGTGEGSVTSSPAGISCPGTCAEGFAEGRLVTLTATPAPHSKLAGWTGCDSNPSPSECKATMSSAKAVSAQFDSLAPKTLSVSVSGAGTVTSTPQGIHCPGECAAPFDEGALVTLTAIPAPDLDFLGWSGGGCSGTARTCQVAMSSAQAVSASFPAAGPGPSDALAQGAALTRLSPRLRLGAVTVKGASVRLRLRVPGPGSLSVEGRGLQRRELKVAEAGALVLGLHLRRSARRALHRGWTLRTRAKAAFRPLAGKTLRATRRLRFRARR
jgi:DNA-binding beta-propeller fold protein YncE